MKIIECFDKVHPNNYSKRAIYKEGICYHITTDKNYNQALRWFGNKNAIASSHYIVERNGDIMHCVEDIHKAYHAGIIKRPTAQIVKDNRNRNPNNYLIGIEVVSEANGFLTEVQFQALKDLTKYLCNKYNIPIGRYHLIGHNEVNRTDKVFCPVSVYSVNEVIQSIKYDNKVAQMDGELSRIVNEFERELKEKDSIIKKARKYGKDMYKYYQDMAKKFFKATKKRG